MNTTTLRRGCGIAALALLTSIPTAQADVFIDDFNRADSAVVGNGWTQSAGNLGRLEILNGELTNLGLNSDNGLAGIFRPADHSRAITVEAKIKEMSGYGSLVGRYTSAIAFRNDGVVGHGIEVDPGQSDSFAGTPELIIRDNGILVSRHTFPFRLGPEITLLATLYPDGGMFIQVSQPGNVFQLSTGPEAFASSGSNVGIRMYAIDGSSSPRVFPRIDDVTVTTGANLIVNGSFELPALPPSSGLELPAGSTAMPGWTIAGTGGPALLQHSVTAVDGVQNLNFNSGNRSPGTSISQSFNTVIGAHYNVTFYVGRTGGGGGNVSLRASVKSDIGSVLAQTTAAGYVPNSYGDVQQLPFTATSTTTTLEFLDLSDATVAVDVLLDNVAVELNVNHAPVADAGETQGVPEDTDVSLTASATDQDSGDEPLLTFAWQQIGGPTVALSASGNVARFHTPIVTAGGDPLAKVTLKFAVTATDPHGAVSAPDEVEMIVANIDHSPIANAGGITVANEAVRVTLDGSLSNDPDGDTLSYAWLQTAGPVVALSNANTPHPYFTAPFVNVAGATLKFRLTVNDIYGGTSSDTATVSLLNINDPPNAASAKPSLGTLWPPNHQMLAITILGADPNNNAVISITGVSQDEPTNGLGDGDTSVDAIINVDGTVLLRAERSGKGNGRVYHIHFTATDFEGSASGVVKVSVPHDKKGDIAIDDGELYDSTH